VARGSEPRRTTITVRVRPRSLPGIVLAGDLVVVSVAAPPVEGRATEEARRALAAALGIAAGRVVLRSGRGSRTKVFVVAGLSSGQVARRLSSGRDV